MYLKMVNAMAKNPSGAPVLNFDGGSYFDLDIIGRGDFSIEIDVIPLSTDVTKFPTIGSQINWSTPTDRLSISYAANENIWFSNPGAINNTTSGNIINYVNTRHIFYVDKSKLGIDGVYTTLGSGSVGIFNRSILLGTCPDNLSDGVYSVMDFYSATMKLNGVEIAHIVPYADNVIYDTIRDRYFNNLGVGQARFRKK